MSSDVHPTIVVRDSPLLGRVVAVEGLAAGRCSFRCVYCPTPPVRPTTARRASDDIAAVTAAVDRAWERAGRVDHIVVGGQGDPLLWTGCQDLVRRLRARHARPVVLLTPAALLTRGTIRAAAAGASLVVVKVDAATPRGLQQVNRPHPGVRFRRLTEALMQTGSLMPGRLWVHTVLVSGVNDGPPACRMIAANVAQMGASTLVLAGTASETLDPNHRAWQSLAPHVRVVIQRYPQTAPAQERPEDDPSTRRMPCWSVYAVP